MISAFEVKPPTAAFLLKTPSEGHCTSRQQLGKKRLRSSISGINGVSNIVKPIRKVHFVESSPLLSCTIHGDRSNIESSTGRSESTSNDQISPYSSINKDNAWYSKSELAEFTRQARDYVMGSDHQWGNADHSYCTRGYERYNIARAQQKSMTRNIILLLMQQKTLNDEEKSSIAQRSSAWAVEEAFLMGCKDYCEAYHPQSSHLLLNNNSDASTMNVKNATIITSTEKIEESKRKRMKHTVISDHESNEQCNHIRSRAA
mmetsp:Transcript_21149/g.44901  ORF Transcript_21149/g.44901 Transcript_21149/m.44901 type:complete len:260 (+) Transcript_21149:152-931(+)